MRIMIFELEITGHHPGYLRHLLRYWPDVETHLTFVVSPEFALHHPDVVQTPTKATVTWRSITTRELHWYEQSKHSLVRRAWAEWRLYCRYAKKTKAEQGLIMYVDRFQLLLALRLFLPCPTSGIFFRPKFHYDQFAAHHPARGEQLRTLRQEWLWRSALRHPQLKTVFSLDPLAIEPLHTFGGNTQIIPLPDPVEYYPQVLAKTARLRQGLGLEPARKVLLIFGMIDRRKGIFQLLEALCQISPIMQEQLALLIVGPLAPNEQEAIMATIGNLQQQSTVQIVLLNEFIEDDAIQPYFAAADLVLALYQRHVGMSAILVRAAAAGKPVLASDYGLMGKIVQQYRLGTVVDSTDSAQIATVLERLSPIDCNDEFDRQMSADFAAQNSAQRFVDLIERGLHRAEQG